MAIYLLPASSESQSKFRNIIQRVVQSTDLELWEDQWIIPALEGEERIIHDVYSCDENDFLIGVGFDIAKYASEIGKTVYVFTDDPTPDYRLFMCGEEEEILERLEKAAVTYIENNPKEEDNEC